jgi:hypothetical protein
LVLDWFPTHPVAGHPLNFASGATWFSEALLPSAFRPSVRGDPLGEARTHADGVIGHFLIGTVGKADLILAPGATQLVVVEAKLFAPLSAGVGHAKGFDQAARNVACMIEVLHRANRPAATMDNLAFCVIAPDSKISKRSFAKLVTPDSIGAKVAQRVSAYEGTLDTWYQQRFMPGFPFIDLRVLSWEAIITDIAAEDPTFAEALTEFYQKALLFNSKMLGRPPA